MEDLFGSSAYTLQKQTPTKWSFSKEERFKSPKHISNIAYLSPQSTISPRSTSLGFGSKWELINNKGKNSPPPGTYDLPTTFNKNLGPKLVKSNVLPLIPSRYITPGPGAYNPNNNGHSSPRYTFRMKNRVRKSIDGPSPGAYDLNFTQTEFSPYKNIAFGYDARKFLAKAPDTGPGPGYYNIS